MNTAFAFELKWQKLLQQSIGEWDDRAQSKEQIEAKRSKRQEAAVRREKAMTYAFTHQVLAYHFL